MSFSCRGINVQGALVGAIKKELENFNSRGTLLLKYGYTEDYQLKRKPRFVVCGFSQIKEMQTLRIKTFYFQQFGPCTMSH
jgi:hypothetical protein